MASLGVNIDHVATLRAQRGTKYPDPIDAAVLAQFAGADQITVHLREDRRHIIDRDVKVLKEILQIPLNLEMANTKEMLEIALSIKPNMVTLVPEKREEKTTEGGLNVKDYYKSLSDTVSILQENNIPTSLFIEPNFEDIELTAKMSAKMIEIHTGKYAELDGIACDEEFLKIEKAAQFANKCNLIVHAGHGLHYRNCKRIAQIKHMQDLNIGHSIISYAVLVGLERAVREMKNLITN
jgi:pyridoxine 5-phosphate synthase